MEQLGPEHKEVTERVVAMVREIEQSNPNPNPNPNPKPKPKPNPNQVREIEQWWAQLQQESAAPPPAEAEAPASSRSKRLDRQLSDATSRLFGREGKAADGAEQAAPAATAPAGEVKVADGAKQGRQLGRQLTFSSV